MADHGPFQTEDEARMTPAVRAVHEAYRDAEGSLSGTPLILAACEAAGVELGAYDARIAAWAGNWEPHVCAVFAGLIARAREAGETAAMEGTETQWGLRLTGESCEPIFDPYPDEQAARSMVPAFRGVFETVVIRREAGPWKEAAETEGNA